MCLILELGVALIFEWIVTSCRTDLSFGIFVVILIGLTGNMDLGCDCGFEWMFVPRIEEAIEVFAASIDDNTSTEVDAKCEYSSDPERC